MILSKDHRSQKELNNTLNIPIFFFEKGHLARPSLEAIVGTRDRTLAGQLPTNYIKN
jgi:hypothetical protein